MNVTLRHTKERERSFSKKQISEKEIEELLAQLATDEGRANAVYRLSEKAGIPQARLCVRVRF